MRNPDSASNRKGSVHHGLHPRSVEFCYQGGRRSGAHATRDDTLKEKARITAGAVAALVIVSWLVVIAVAVMAG